MIYKCPTTGQRVKVRRFRSLDTLTESEISRVHALWKRKSRKQSGSAKMTEEKGYKAEARALLERYLEIK